MGLIDTEIKRIANLTKLPKNLAILPFYSFIRTPTFTNMKPDFFPRWLRLIHQFTDGIEYNFKVMALLEIKNLSFRYNEERPFLFSDFNLNVKPGHCVSIMGASGSGKSTLTKLLQGFYLPTEGNILIDNRNILHLSANELRDYFGVVPQETTLFSGTLYDNLIMANPTASFEQVIQACQMAEIHEQIEEMPQGYQTEIGEHGVGLSGGQKQRIAIARAILKRPKILVFDEATSNLDQPTSEAFAKTINNLKGKVTILFITHQLPKGLKVDDAVILGKQQEHIIQDTIKDEGA